MPAAPEKLSLYAVVQPDGGAGTVVADAAALDSILTASALAPASV